MGKAIYARTSQPPEFEAGQPLSGNAIAPGPTPGPECNLHACYSQSGRIVSARITPGLIPHNQVDNAASIIRRRVAIIESVLHAWVDHLLDRTVPGYSWEAEKEDWEDRRDFERYYRCLKAEKKAKEESDERRKWHDEEIAARTRTPSEESNWSEEEARRYEDPDTWVEEIGFAPTNVEVEARRKLKHRKIRFIPLHEYHRLEGNKDEMDDPSSYL